MAELPVEGPQVVDGKIYETLREAIRIQVKKDGIRKDAILEWETEEDVIEDATDAIFYDVEAFYNWLFVPDDERYNYIKNQKRVAVLPSLIKVVAPTVADNLREMEEAELIPEGQDTPAFRKALTDDLVRYILNWEDWYYLRKQDEAIDDYFLNKSIYEETYLDDPYGDLSNVLDDSQYDGYSDVPYIAEP